MGTGVKDDDYNTVKHEYGHTVQFEQLGLWKYLKQVGIPSVTGYLLGDELPYDYYTAPWEAEADMYGDVAPSDRKKKKRPWSEEEDGYYDLGDLVNALSKRLKGV